MQPRTLDQVLGSLNSVYDPQIQSIQARQAAIPGQIAQEEQGLQAKQETAFGDILNGARRRGTGVAFGGIPLAEQSRYTADTYLPALANLRTAGHQEQTSLADAINKINADKFSQGQGIYQYETSLAEQQRQFNESQALAREQAAASARAANAFNPTLGAGGAINPTTTDPTQAKTLAGGKSPQDAYNAVQSLMNTRNTDLIGKTYQAIYQSANNGNTYDQTKLSLLQQVFGNSLAKNGIGLSNNGGALKF